MCAIYWFISPVLLCWILSSVFVFEALHTSFVPPDTLPRPHWTAFSPLEKQVIIHHHSISFMFMHTVCSAFPLYKIKDCLIVAIFFLINRPQTELKNHRPKSFFCLVLFLLGCCCHSVKQESHPSLKHLIPTHPHFLTCLTPKNDKNAKQDGDNVKKQKKKNLHLHQNDDSLNITKF